MHFILDKLCKIHKFEMAKELWNIKMEDIIKAIGKIILDKEKDINIFKIEILIKEHI